MPFKRYVEIGRVALVNYGKDYGKLVVIVDVIDQNRALVDAPDMVRSQMNFKRLSLTDIKIDINRVPKKKNLIEAMEKADVKNKWENSSWGRKLIVQKRRAALNDFDICLPSMASTLPPAAQAASQAALKAAIADSPELEPGEIEEGQDVIVDVAKFDEMRTVFSDPQTFNVKHPLYSAWTLWFDSPNTKGKNLPQTPSTSVPPTPGGVPPTPGAVSWMDDIKRLIKFDSVEEFWGLYNNIISPSKLPSKANYYLFKDDIMPAWEDPQNKDGGKWSVQLPKDKNRARIDEMWLYTMLAAIGETFDPALSKAADPNSTAPVPTSLISGVIVSSRPQFYRISIWTRLAPGVGAGNPSNPNETEEAIRQRIEHIGRHFKTEVLGFQESQRIGGPLATEVEFASHKESEKKGSKGKKWAI